MQAPATLDAVPRRTLAHYLAPLGLTAALCVAAALASFWPTAAEWLQFERDAFAAGQWWRLLTCHLTHWSPDHFLWNAAVFAVLGGACEAACRLRFAGCLLASAIAVPLAVWLVEPQMGTYRGLSGLDTALFGLLAVTTLRSCWAQRNWPWLVAVGTLSAGLALKIGFEQVTGRTVFVDSGEAGFTPVPLAHVVGQAAGVLVAILAPSPSASRGGARGEGRASVVKNASGKHGACGACAMPSHRSAPATQNAQLGGPMFRTAPPLQVVGDDSYSKT